MVGATNWWRTYSFRKIYIVLRTWRAKLQKMHNWLYDLTTRQYALLYNHGRDSCLSGSGIYATMKCNVLITNNPLWHRPEFCFVFCYLMLDLEKPKPLNCTTTRPRLEDSPLKKFTRFRPALCNHAVIQVYNYMMYLSMLELNKPATWIMYW